MIFGILSLLALGQRGSAHLDPSTLDIREQVRSAEFIFRGHVIGVQYRDAEKVIQLEGSTPAFEEGLPVFQDGSGTPHTFVTYQIDEIIKGNPPQIPGGGSSDKLILRFLGGPSHENPDEILFVPTYPHMDIGDHDFLFVRNNTVYGCPLVKAENGRYRILSNPNKPTEPPLIYTDRGYEIVHLASGQNAGEIDTGQFHNLPEIQIFTIGNHRLERDVVLEENEYGDPTNNEQPEPSLRKGPHFAATQFSVFLHQVVAELYTPEQLRLLPPVVSADPSIPFVIEPLDESGPANLGLEPDPEPVARPWLNELPEAKRQEILQAELLEAELTRATGGDPVLPGTPCEREIFAGGRIPGDISGPEGKPDCKVDLNDLAQLSLDWLSCIGEGCPQF